MITMVNVSLSSQNGDVFIECDTCVTNMSLPFGELAGVFADVKIGRMVLEMLEHIHREHGAGMALMKPSPG